MIPEVSLFLSSNLRCGNNESRLFTKTANRALSLNGIVSRQYLPEFGVPAASFAYKQRTDICSEFSSPLSGTNFLAGL